MALFLDFVFPKKCKQQRGDDGQKKGDLIRCQKFNAYDLCGSCWIHSDFYASTPLKTFIPDPISGGGDTKFKTPEK